MRRMFYALLLFLCYYCGVNATRNQTIYSTTVRFNDTYSHSSNYVCASSLNPILTPLHPSILVDVRDIQLNNIGLVNVYEKVNSRINSTKENFPQAAKRAHQVALLMEEDHSENYDLANRLNVPIVLAVPILVERNVGKPYSDYKGYVFFVTKVALEALDPACKTDKNLSGLVIDFLHPPTPSLEITVFAFLFLKFLSISSIVAASLIVLRNYDDLLHALYRARTESSIHPCLKAVVPIFFLCTAIGTILLCYFFYDIMVYFIIFIFVTIGASSMSFVFTAVLSMMIPALKHRFFHIRKLEVNATRFALFFVFLVFTITWCVYRNDPAVGWVMQDVIGFFIVIQMLVDLAPFCSLKGITIVFALFVIYDVFFVFLTPFFTGKSVQPMQTPQAAESHTETYQSLSRQRRGVSPGDSIMEAVATGSAGKSGELMPLAFKFSFAALLQYPDPCSGGRDYSLLGYGDAVIPGTLCAFCAFYDACWKRRLPWNFLAALLGYILGGIVCSVVLHTSRMAQPALVYFCPIMLIVVALCGYLRSGLSELRSLWNCSLPTVMDESGHTEDFGLNGTNGNPLSDAAVKVEVVGEKNDPVLREEPFV